MHLQLDEAQTRKQLDIMYSDSPQNSSIIIFTLPEKKTRLYKILEMEKMISDLKSIAKNQNVFFNVLPQDEDALSAMWKENNKDGNGKYTGRGFKETTTSLKGLWLDVDYCDANHSEKSLPTEQESCEFIKSLPIMPSYMVESGHGYHVYYLFKHVWEFRDSMDREKAERLSKSFQKYVINSAHKKGWNLDYTGDPMRMLRLAGTYNLKDADNPKLVTICEENPENRYSIEDFEALLEPTDQKLVIIEKNVQGDYKACDIKLIEEKCKFIYSCHDNASTLGEQSWYALLGILSRCVNGEALCHEWSEPHPNYSDSETQAKLEHAKDSASPRTCANISQITNGEFCNSCPHFEKITSPIVLGAKMTERPLSIDEAIVTAKNTVEAVLNGDFGAHLTNESIAAFSTLQLNNPSEFVRLKQELKDRKVQLAEFNKLVKSASKRIEAEKMLMEFDKEKKEDHFVTVNSQAGNSISIIIPPRYIVRNDGILEIKHVGDDHFEVQICYSPVMLTGRFRDIDNNKERVEVTWKKNGFPFWSLIDREYIANSRKIIELASEGFPVHSGNSSDLVRYLAAFESLNLPYLPTSFTSSHLGWQGRNCGEGFLLSDTHITLENDETPNISRKIIFRPESPGEIQAVSGFHQKGSYDGWLKAIEKINNYPRVLLLFYAAFASVLLEPLGAPNFVIELANRTSTGKTSALRVAASVWGCPDEKAMESIIWSWDGTKVWLERICAILNGMPLLLDDTKRAKYPGIVAEMIYAISNGKGRGRGNLKGLADTKSWRTIMISTAETPSVYLTNDGGTRGRVLEITGMPFGQTDEQTRQFVTGINARVNENYGFAGPLFAEYVLQNKEKWSSWKNDLRDLVASYSDKAKSAVSGRLAEYAALIEFTKNHVDELFDLPFLFDNPVETLWSEIVNESRDATGEREALNQVISWAFANSESFEGRHVVSEGKLRIPSSGWAGRWKQSDDWYEIAFLPHKLKDLLKHFDYDPEAILRGWAELGWLNINERGTHKYSKQLRFFENPTWMIVLKRDAIEGKVDNNDSD